jgi:predicted rRNA methylase YqxC with S4 and FtsJ domains
VIRFVSRAGLKLAHALKEFNFDVNGLVCADFGCNVGGFTDCLLQRGAAKVYAIDTGYGTLAYKLRVDPRVVVMERTNALHAEPPSPGGSKGPGNVDLVVIDLAWTPQRHAIPAAVRWLSPPPSKGGGGGVGDAAASALRHDPSGPHATNDSPSPSPSLKGRGVQSDTGHLITLVKPHYEVEGEEKPWLVNGTLSPEHAEQIFQRVLASFPALGVGVLDHCRSPIPGGKSSQKAAASGAHGNVEFLVLARPKPAPI